MSKLIKIKSSEKLGSSVILDTFQMLNNQI